MGVQQAAAGEDRAVYCVVLAAVQVSLYPSSSVSTAAEMHKLGIGKAKHVYTICFVLNNLPEQS